MQINKKNKLPYSRGSPEVQMN